MKFWHRWLWTSSLWAIILLSFLNKSWTQLDKFTMSTFNLSQSVFCVQLWMHQSKIQNSASSRLFTVPYFPWDCRCWLLSSKDHHLGLLMQAKLGRVQNAFGTLLPTAFTQGHFLLSQFRLHQETKRAAHRTTRSASTFSWKNRGLWTVYVSRLFFRFPLLHSYHTKSLLAVYISWLIYYIIYQWHKHLYYLTSFVLLA